MRKPSKVVCITEKRRKPDHEVERPIPLSAEAIGTLRFERTGNRMDFFLTPLFGRGPTKEDGYSRKANLTVLPSPSDPSGE
jgi:hypothetical protein